MNPITLPATCREIKIGLYVTWCAMITTPFVLGSEEFTNWLAALGILLGLS